MVGRERVMSLARPRSAVAGTVRVAGRVRSAVAAAVAATLRAVAATLPAVFAALMRSAVAVHARTSGRRPPIPQPAGLARPDRRAAAFGVLAAVTVLALVPIRASGTQAAAAARVPAVDSATGGGGTVGTVQGPEWRRVDWGELRFRISGPSGRGELDEARLAEVVGARTVARIARHAYAIGADGTLAAAWDRDGRTLRAFAGRVPVAEFIDRDGDRRIDLVRLAFYR